MRVRHARPTLRGAADRFAHSAGPSHWKTSLTSTIRQVEDSAKNRPRRRQNRPQITPGGSKIDPQIGKKTMKNQKIDPGASRRAKKCVSSMSAVVFWRKMAPQGGQMGPEIDPKIEKIGTKSRLFSREGPGGHFGAFWGRK